MTDILTYIINSVSILISVSQDKVKTTTTAPSIGQDNHQQQRIPITTPKPRPSQSPGGSFQDHSSHLGDNNKSNGVSSRESENPTATIRVEKNPNFTPAGGVPPNEYTTISAAGRPLTLQKNQASTEVIFLFTFGQSLVFHIGQKTNFRLTKNEVAQNVQLL